MKKGMEELIVELAVSAIGWLVNMAILVGAFALGFAASKWFGGFDPNVPGFLSAAAMVWLYEHRLAHSRREKLNERLDRLWEKTAGLD